eukprot:gb/GECH01013872.1/.p1 GENE.gb/GECH01013872.1/~~gb/GECH01013872.1/.p1  ORF type:complete len:366 (+),score=102.50 gb/GECH01013872.1/:1-1098(+)
MEQQQQEEQQQPKKKEPQSSPSKVSPTTVDTRIKEAISIAHQAVEADKAGNIEKARALYSEAAHRLQQMIGFVPEGHSQIVKKYCTVYMNRATELKETLSRTPQQTTAGEHLAQTAPTKQFQPPEFPVPFVEEEIPEIDIEPAPEDPHRRTFWLISLLLRTMRNGGFLTPELYISKAVWTQEGAKIAATQAKAEFCSRMTDELRILKRKDPKNPQELCPSLDEFLLKSEGIHDVLIRKHPSLSNTGDQSTGGKLLSFGRSIARGAGSWTMGLVANRGNKSSKHDNEPYVPWLIMLLEESMFLDDWLEHCREQNNQEATQKLERISVFMYNHVCIFVLHDLNHLLDRYLRKTRESLSRLFPKHYKH